MAAVRKLSLVFDFILTINKSLELVKLNLVRGESTKNTVQVVSLCYINGEDAKF